MILLWPSSWQELLYILNYIPKVSSESFVPRCDAEIPIIRVRADTDAYNLSVVRNPKPAIGFR